MCPLGPSERFGRKPNPQKTICKPSTSTSWGFLHWKPLKPQINLLHKPLLFTVYALYKSTFYLLTLLTIADFLDHPVDWFSYIRKRRRLTSFINIRRQLWVVANKWNFVVMGFRWATVCLSGCLSVYVSVCLPILLFVSKVSLTWNLKDPSLLVRHEVPGVVSVKISRAVISLLVFIASTPPRSI